MHEGPEDFFLSSKARYQNSQDEEDAAELFFAVRNMLNHGLDVEWDETIVKAMAVLEQPKETTKPAMEAAVTVTPKKTKTKGPKAVPRVRTVTEVQPFPPTPTELEGPTPYIDRYWMTPSLYDQQVRTKTGGVTDEGMREPGEEIKFLISLMVGGREAVRPDNPTIPSRYFDIQSHMHYTDNHGNRVNFGIHDIDPDVWLRGPGFKDRDGNLYPEWEKDPLKWLRDHADEPVPGEGAAKGIKYRDYLRPLIGRAEYTGERRVAHGGLDTTFESEKGRELIPHKSLQSLDPFQALHLTSNSPVTENAARRFHAEFLNPKSPHFVRTVEEAIKKKNEDIRRGQGEDWGQKGHETHLHDMRSRNLKGEIVGDDLPPSFTFTRMYEEYYHDWLERAGHRLKKDMSEEDKRLLFSDWFDLEFDIGQENEEYIAQKLLRLDKGVRKRYNRNDLMLDPEFQHKRDNEFSHHRVGALPYLLGLQLASPEKRMYAFADFVSYLKEEGDHPIEGSLEERAQGASQNMGSMRVDELLDHMHQALTMNMAAIAANMMEHPLEGKGHLPPYFDMNARVRKAIIRDAMKYCHDMPLSAKSKEIMADWPDKDTERAGYDSPRGGKKGEKSLASILKTMDELDDNGIPRGWNLNADPKKEFDRLVKDKLPPNFKLSAQRRFRDWLHEDPKGFIRGRAREYQLGLAHLLHALEPRVEGEGSESHEGVGEHPMSPAFIWHHSLPKTGYNLYGADIAEILYGVMPFLGEKVRNRDMILFDSYKTHRPTFNRDEPNDHPDNHDYSEWLKGIGEYRAPGGWNHDPAIPLAEKGGMSGLAMEIDGFFRGAAMGPILETVYQRLYGDIPENAERNKRKFVSKILKARVGDLLTEYEGGAQAGDSPEREKSMGITEMKDITGETSASERSTLYDARTADTSKVLRRRASDVPGAPDIISPSEVENFPLGRRPIASMFKDGHHRLLGMMLPFVSYKDAVFLREASQMGVSGPAMALSAHLAAQHGPDAAPKDETKARILTMEEAIKRRDKSHQMIDRGTMLRGSSGGMVFPYHMRGRYMPSETLRMLELAQEYNSPGKQFVSLGTDDGTRNPNGTKRGAAILEREGRAGVPTDRGLDAARLGLFVSALLGGGSAAPWSFDHNGSKTLVVDQPGDWGDQWMGNFDNWLREQEHPHIENASLAGHLGVWTDDDWRDRVADARYIYPVEKEMSDTGQEEYRLPFKRTGEGGPGRAFRVPDLGVHHRYPEKLGNEMDFTNVFSLRDSYTGAFPEKEDGGGYGLKDIIGSKGIYPGKPWIVVPKDSTIHYNGQDYVVAGHPSEIKDEYSNILAEHDREEGNNQHRDFILNLRREARDMAPGMEGKEEKEKDADKRARTMELLLRLVGTGHQVARTVLPFMVAHFASHHEPESDLEHFGSDAEWKLDDFIENHLQQHRGDTPADTKRKYATMCHLYELAWDYGNERSADDRADFIKHLEKQGFEFNDKEKERMLSSSLGTNTEFGKRHFVMPDAPVHENHPFHSSWAVGDGENVEGLNILREYAEEMYGPDGTHPDEYLLKRLNKIMDKHFNMGAESCQHSGLRPDAHGRTDGGQPMRMKTLDLMGTPLGDHSDSVYQADHYEKGAEDPLYYISESDAPFSGRTDDEGNKLYRTKHLELAKRGARARMSLNMKGAFEDTMDVDNRHYDHHKDRELNDFALMMGPVIEEVVNDLKSDDFLPEHRPHQDFHPDDIGDILREYRRLLFLRGRTNPDYKPKPWAYLKHTSGNIGDNSSHGHVSLDRLYLPDLSSVHAHDSFHQSDILPFTADVSSGIPQIMARGAPVSPHDVGVKGPFGIDDDGKHFQDPTRDPKLTDEEMQQGKRDTSVATPYRTYDIDVLNSAFGNSYAVVGDKSNTGAALQYTEDPDVRNSLDVLTDVDLLLKEEDRDKGKPVPVKAMHRIFELDDLEYLRGFSDDWVVSSWPAGTRIIVDKKGKKVKARNADGKAVSLPNEVKRGVVDAHDKDFTVDSIWDDERLYIVDILDCEKDDLCSKPTKDRVRHLRAHFESTEKVTTPAPVNTKRVDGQGLKRAVKDLMKEPDVKQVLLRDAESSYMRGETRHPKWVMLTPDHLIDVLVLSSTSDDNHLIGVGPLYDEDARAIGNRAVRYDGDYYMDVGTVTRSGLEEGMYITVKTSGVTHSLRRKYCVYRLNAPRYVKDSESGATDSVETLDILRNRQEGNVPHKVRIKKGKIHIEVPTGHVVYETEPDGNAFILKDVDSPDDYTLRVVQSQMEYWSPLAAVLLRSEREGEKEDIEPEPPANHDKKPKKVLPKKDQLLKDPEVIKTVVVALEVVESMLKEKWTMTGPKALGIDYATPIESPHGPTDITEPYDMPDHDPAARQKDPKACWCGAERGDQCEQGMGLKMEDCPKARPPKKEKKAKHLKVSQNSRTDSSV